jgi:hypothetical protein
MAFSCNGDVFVEPIDLLRTVGEPRPLTERFRATADQLRSGEFSMRCPLMPDENRATAGRSELPTILTKALSLALQLLVDIDDREPVYDLIREAGRVAANLVPGSGGYRRRVSLIVDANRNFLVKASYPEAVLALLALDTSDRRFPIDTCRALTASLLNLTIEGHGMLVTMLC